MVFPVLTEKTGGISGSLNAFYKYLDCSWIGWTGNENIKLNDDQEKKLYKKYEEENCHPIELTDEEICNYHHGFCNQTIWPLFIILLNTVSSTLITGTEAIKRSTRNLPSRYLRWQKKGIKYGFMIIT
jgi:trehalose 6-phosphate synthase/phosphatase